MGVVLDRRGEERAEPEGKAFSLPVDLRPNPHLWSQALDSDLKNEITDTSDTKVSSTGWLSPRSSDIRREFGVEPLLLRVERSSVEVVSDKSLLGAFLWRSSRHDGWMDG